MRANSLVIGNLVAKSTLVVGLALTVGCQGNTSGDEDGLAEVAGQGFVSNADTAGSVALDVNETQIQVGEISGFTFTAYNRDRQPVPGLRLACDSEIGIALVEPSTGSEISDSNGSISGKIGCSAPGSYQFGCRLPVGGNKRQLVTIQCLGPVPTDFDGFSGAGGGGLGSGGAGNITDGGVGGVDATTGVRITSAIFQDDGTLDTSGVLTVDTSQAICSTDDPLTTDVTEPTIYEVFYDAYVDMAVVNNTNSVVKFNNYSYTVTSQAGTLLHTSTASIGLLGSTEVAPNGGTTAIRALFADAVSGGKRFIGASSNITATGIGYVNVNLTLRGTTESGEALTKKYATAVSFAPVNRCEG